MGKTRHSSKESAEDRSIRDMLTDMNKRLLTMPTSADLEKMDRDIRNDIMANAQGIRALDDRFTKYREEVPDMIRSEVNRAITEQHEATAADSAQSQNYMICRRSIRMWPVTDSGKGITGATRSFMKNELKMDQSTISKMSIEMVRELGEQPGARIKNEVLVCFMSVDDRDIVYGHAKNLAGNGGKAGIRMEIPEHLRADFRLL